MGVQDRPMICVPFFDRSSEKMHLCEWYLHALENGVHKVSVGLWKTRKQAHGASGIKERWDKDIVGALGEYAVAEYLGVPMKMQDTLDLEGDVGHIHVRSTPWPKGAHWVYPTDPDEAPFAHVVVNYEDKCCYIMGWVYAKEAKDSVPLTDAKQKGRYAHWIEQGNPVMRPAQSLRELP
jgi:hypothetical protein